MILLLLSLTVFARELPGQELYVAPTVQELRDELDGSPAAHGRPSRSQSGPSLSTAPSHPMPLPTKKRNQQTESEASNLPRAYSNGSHRESNLSELILPPKGSHDTLKSLKVGDKLEATINHWVIAFSDEKAPVVATLTSRQNKNIKLIGESHLEKNSKRIFIEFTRAVVAGKVYTLKASALTDLGQPGFEGEYHSRELEYFSGDFISSFVAGYFDGLVPRTKNAFGQTEEDTSVDSAMKKGMSKGAMSSADRFREKLKKVPEFSELQGPFDLNILILEEAKTN
jgi:hypothetical protein